MPPTRPPAAFDRYMEYAAEVEAELGCDDREAQVIAFYRIVMEYVDGSRWPVAHVQRREDGTWPAWVASWPGPVRWES